MTLPMKMPALNQARNLVVMKVMNQGKIQESSMCIQEGKTKEVWMYGLCYYFIGWTDDPSSLSH